MYFKILSQNMVENLPSRCVRRFIQRFLNEVWRKKIRLGGILSVVNTGSKIEVLLCKS